MARTVLTALFCLVVAACGGGSDDSADTSETTSPLDITAADLTAETTTPKEVTTDIGQEPEPEPPGLVRFIHVSDLHYKGQPGKPVTGKVANMVAALNEVNFDADGIFLTGDLCDFVPDKYNEPGVETPFHLLAALLDNLTTDWFAMPGNHDYYAGLNPWYVTSDKDAREAAMEDALGKPDRFVEEINGVNLIAFNSVDGETWETNDGLVGSYSDEALAWLKDQLAKGRPSILFMHHPPTTMLTIGDQDSLCDVITEFPGVLKGIFAGHLHSFQRGDYCGVPAYVVTKVDPNTDFYFLVEYDGPTDTLTIVNEDHVPFVEPPEFTCTGGGKPALLHPENAVDTIQALYPQNMMADVEDVGQYAGEVFEAIPMVVHIDGFDEDEQAFAARLSLASRWGDTAGFVSYLEGMPCLEFDLHANDPCFTAGPISFGIDVMTIFGAIPDVEAPETDWDVSLEIENFWIEGRFAEVSEVPIITEGVLHGRVLGTKAVNDMKNVLVVEYCAGNIDGCEPGGADDMPECPAADPGQKFFTQIPAGCDVIVMDFSLRMIIVMAESFGFADMDVIGEISSAVVPASDEPLPGHVESSIFSTEEGMNCAP